MIAGGARKRSAVGGMSEAKSDLIDRQEPKAADSVTFDFFGTLMTEGSHHILTGGV